MARYMPAVAYHMFASGQREQSGHSANTLVACRSGVTDVIFPQGNKKEYEEVPEDLKQGITPHFVDNYEQIYKLAFPDTGGSSSSGGQGQGQ